MAIGWVMEEAITIAILADFDGATVSTIYACQEADFSPAPHDVPVKEVLVDESTI